MPDDYPLERHDLHRLEAAAKELDAHILARRPDRASWRTVLTWGIALLLTLGGGYLLVFSVMNGKFFGPTWFGIGLFIAGLGIIISEVDQR